MMNASRLAVCGLLAAAFAVGVPAVAAIPSDVETYAAGWPEPSRTQAQAMIEQYGRPDRSDGASLTWIGLFGGKRTVVHRAEAGQPAFEQAVHYEVPAKKVADLTSFEPNISIDRKAAEMSVRGNSVSENLLALNLAHDVASGFKTVDEARTFRDNQLQLAQAGKSSRYRDVIIFEQPMSTISSPFSTPTGQSLPPKTR